MGFTMQIRPDVLARLRDEFPPGTKVILDEMCDPYREIPSGMKGEILYIDDAGGAHIQWANGSTLAAIHGVDRFHRDPDQ